MSIKVLIVEDNLLQAWNIEKMLEELNNYEVLKICQTADIALEYIERKQPDVLLVDICLLGEMNGIELAQTIIPKNIPVIFITQYEDDDTYRETQNIPRHAFLLKPFHKYTLESTIQLLLPPNIQAFPDSLIYIKVGNKREVIHPRTIHWIESKRNYCTIQTEHGQYTVKRSLKSIQNSLPKGEFIFIHKSFLVRLPSIKQINIKAQSVLVNHDLLPLGRTYIKALSEHLIHLG
jgi:two-component system response regulator LytT